MEGRRLQSVFFTSGLAELLVGELQIQQDMGSEGRRGEIGIAKSVSFLFHVRSREVEGQRNCW